MRRPGLRWSGWLLRIPYTWAPTTPLDQAGLPQIRVLDARTPEKFHELSRAARGTQNLPIGTHPTPTTSGRRIHDNRSSSHTYSVRDPRPPRTLGT